MTSYLIRTVLAEQGQSLSGDPIAAPIAQIRQVKGGEKGDRLTMNGEPGARARDGAAWRKILDRNSRSARKI